MNNNSGRRHLDLPFTTALFALLPLVLLSSTPTLASAPTPAPLTAKAHLPAVLLYPATAGDIAALVDLRTRLRLDGRVEVLTYDPESAAIQRASAEGGHPEWLISAPTTDAGRMILARALGTAFYAVVSPGRATDSTHVELVETAPAARTFDWTGSNRQFGVRAIESQVADATAHPAADLASTDAPSTASIVFPSVVASAPSVVASAPSVVASAPSVVASAPSVVASAPTAAPIIIAVPKSVPPVSTPSLPSVQTARVPLTLPTASVPALAVPSLPPPARVAVVPPKIVPAPLPVIEAPVIVQPKALPTVIVLPQSAASPAAAPVTPPARVIPAPKAVLIRPEVAASTPSASMPAPMILPAAPIVVPPRAIVSSPVPAAVIAPPKVAVVSPPAPAPVQIAPPASVIPPKKPVQVAALPKPTLPVPPLSLPEAKPIRTPKPDAPIAVRKPTPKAEDMSAVQPLLAKGDAALDGGDAVSAIALYRQAINGAPLSIVPRLKLAQAYQKDGLSDRALDEARRALQIAPDNVSVQQFLSDLDQQTGTSDGTLVRDRAALERSPSDPAAHATLADALWNNGDLSGAEAEYKASQALAPIGSHEADAHLAQLYAAEARYDDCLAALRTAGKGGYALAIQIVKNRAETLSSTLSASRDTFAAKKSTREQFYDDAKKLSAEAQALAGFVAQVTPPTEYRLSHLHRTLSTNLLAQEAATLVTFIETGDSRQNDSISQLERAAATEMLTAQATEEKRGLWKTKP